MKKNKINQSFDKIGGATRLFLSLIYVIQTQRTIGYCGAVTLCLEVLSKVSAIVIYSHTAGLNAVAKKFSPQYILQPIK